tara:strand:- start:950 stop:1504 length:555 start_codon:yes stop_codon:yes gene_type:complete
MDVMKRTLFFLAASFVITATAQASEVNSIGLQTKTETPAFYLQPVVFITQGVEFLIYPDGTLDYNLPPSSVSLNGRRVNQVYYNSNSVYDSGNNYRRGYVQYHRNGQVAQIGRLLIDYHRNGRVGRIGDVAITYKKGRLDKIGNLKMHYDRSGRIYKQTGTIYKGNITKDKHRITVYGDRSRRS